MKICPKCQTEYDEEIIRFCTKDGAPLVDKGAPDFSDKMPSEASKPNIEDDEGEKTIIRRKAPAPNAGTQPLNPEAAGKTPKEEKSDSKRMVISTSGDEGKAQGVRPKAAPIRKEEPKKSNTAVIVLMSIIGTMIVMLGAVGVYWYLTLADDPDANSNLNIEENTNQDGNENYNADDFNINFNGNFEDNTNANSNSNSNANAETPTPSPTKTPTPTPSPSPSASPTASPGDSNSNTNTGTPTITPTVTATPTPAPTKTPTPTPKPSPPSNTNTPVNVGTVNGRATSLPTPSYPSAARNARATGRVNVAVVIDRNGNVVSARAVSGHPLLRASAVAAARRSRFRPVKVNGQNVRARGTIQYNFKN